MEEKVLIKSVSSKSTKWFFIGVTIVILIVSVIFLIVAINYAKEIWCRRNSIHCYDNFGNYEYQMRCLFCGEVCLPDKMNAHLFKFHGDVFYNYDNIIDLAPELFAVHWIVLFLAGVFCLIYFLISRCNITISDKNISGRTFFGKKVVLPIHMVSAYSISKIFSVVSITTSSGSIKFPCIGNAQEIADVLQQLLNERQKKTETQENLISQQSSSSNLDDLVKLKQLLDSGVITKEEYAVKKKQILGF